MARTANVPASTDSDLLSERGQLNGGEMIYIHTIAEWRKYCQMRNAQEQVRRARINAAILRIWDERWDFYQKGWDLK